ncbi:hypothetical protein Tco_0801597 [Tanacetum coccineum]|uniref:Uncharacterized protein n=1 Tax=Tanacetum coccineum TaxID=301880 RepID=A0ABQ4ZWH2_9ASTR
MGWAYTACKKCNKKVDILPRQNRPPVYVCEEHGTVQPASRFKESSDELAQSTTKKNKGIIEDSSDEHDSDMHPTSKTKKNKAIIEDNKAIIEESSDEHVSDMHTASKKMINKAIIEESSDEHDLDMQTPTKTRKSTSRVKVSTSKKGKLIIDEHEVESEAEEEANISKAHELGAEQMEPED